MIKIDVVTDTRGILTTDTPARLLEVSRGLPGRYKWVRSQLFFEITRNNLEHLSRELPQATWSEKAREHLSRIEAIALQEREISGNKARDLAAEVADFPFKTTPFTHQVQAFALSRDQEYFGLFMEMGTGKSKVLIDTAAYLFLQGKIDGVVVLAPNGVHRQWIREQIPAHMSDSVKWVGSFYQSGMGAAASYKIKQQLSKTDNLRILAMNVEACSHKSGVDFLTDWMSKIGRVLLIVDESSRIGNMSAKRTKEILKKIAPLSSYRRIASGTPISKGVEDLYSQLYFLNPNILGFSSFYTFRNFYCVMGGFERKQIVSYQNLEILTKKLDSCTFRVTKEECLDLPERTLTTRAVELTPEQKSMYKDLRKNFLLEMREGQILSAPLAVTRIIRLRQILSGHINDVGQEESTRIPSNRAAVTLECVQEATGKVLVWCSFREDIRLLAETLTEAGIGFVEYHGGVSSADREVALKNFKEDDSVRVMLSNPQAGGIGLNLVVANVAIWYSPTFSLQDYLQANDRIHRIGQTKNTLYIHLVAEGTLERGIYERLMAKKTIADTVLDLERMFEEDGEDQMST
jgi:hypothetical protein